MSHIDIERLFRHGIDAGVLQVVFAWIFIEFRELLGNIGADIAVAFLEIKAIRQRRTNAFTPMIDHFTLIDFAVSSDCSGGMFGSRSRNSDWMK